MLKRRFEALEKRLAGLGGAGERQHRLVFRFGDGTRPNAITEAEAQAEPECVLRFDYGDGGPPQRTNEKPIDVAENSHPTEREKKRK